MPRRANEISAMKGVNHVYDPSLSPRRRNGLRRMLLRGILLLPHRRERRAFLRDYGQVLVEKCNFTYVAITREQQVVGFISGKYSKGFSKALASRCDTARHYGAWVRMFLKFYLRGYKLSAAFQKQFEAFFQQARERDNRDFRDCDLELVALSSKRDFRKGLGDRVGRPVHGACKGGRRRLCTPDDEHARVLGIL